jgi:flagellar basal-body rod protein FlgC
MVEPIDISASGLYAQRLRMEVIANNIANSLTTNSSEIVEEIDGTFYTRYVPFRRKEVIFQVGIDESGLGVSCPKVIDDMAPFKKEYKPSHPHAVKNPKDPDFGYVLYPNIDPLIEQVDMFTATRAYEANLAAIEALKSMVGSSLRILA